MTSSPEIDVELPPYLVPHSQDYIRILYADDSLLIVDKPHLLLRVPGRHRLNRDCLLSRLEQRFPGVAAAHRLDLDTSGLLVVPRNKSTLIAMNKQFQDRAVLKTYRALVYGQVKDDEGQIDLPITGDWHNRPRQKICTKTGKPSLTHYRVLDRQSNSSLLELKPVTGRSHQLRIHLMALGHPIMGCDLYAHQEALSAAPRLLLHANQLTFKHPLTQGLLRAYSPAPFDIKGLLALRPG